MKKEVVKATIIKSIDKNLPISKIAKKIGYSRQHTTRLINQVKSNNYKINHQLKAENL